MKKLFFLAIFTIVFSVFNACQKEVSDVESSSNKDSTFKCISANALADSLKSITIGINEVDEIATNMNRLKSGTIYTDWSGKISFKVFETTSTMNQHNDGLITYVDPDYVCVGGGGYTLYSDDAGAFFTESRPLADLSGWVVSSKDHVNSDPHILVSQAIGIKIEGVSSSVLKQYIRIKTSTSSSSHMPYAEAYESSGYTMIGGGSKIIYNGGGILLVSSQPSWDSTHGYKWGTYGKDHRISDTGTITSYLIEASKDSIPGFGKLNIATTHGPGNYVSYGLSTSIINIAANSSGIACLGGTTTDDTGYGRFIKGLKINSPISTEVTSIDNYYRCAGVANSDVIRISKK